MSRETQRSGDLLYSNVRVRGVAPDIAAGALTVKVVYAEREEQKMLYDGVLYSQLDESSVGKLIALAMELIPDEYRGGKHMASAKKFQQDCNLKNLNALDEMVRQGYRIFTHYIGDQDEYIVIAKKLLLGQ